MPVSRRLPPEEGGTSTCLSGTRLLRTVAREELPGGAVFSFIINGTIRSLMGFFIDLSNEVGRNESMKTALWILSVAVMTATVYYGLKYLSTPDSPGWLQFVIIMVPMLAQQAFTHVLYGLYRKNR